MVALAKFKFPEILGGLVVEISENRSIIISDNCKKKLHNTRKTLHFYTIITSQYLINLPVVFPFDCVPLKKSRKGIYRDSELVTPRCVSVARDCFELRAILASGSRETSVSPFNYLEELQLGD